MHTKRLMEIPSAFFFHRNVALPVCNLISTPNLYKNIERCDCIFIVNKQKNTTLESELQDVPEEVRAGIFSYVCCRGKSLYWAAKKYKVSARAAIASVYDQSLKIERARAVNS